MQFYETNEAYQKNIALITPDGVSLTYAGLHSQADKIGRFMQPRNLAFLFCNYDAPAIAAYLGMLRKKVIPLLLQQNIAPDLLQDLLREYHPQYLYLPEVLCHGFDGYHQLENFDGYILLGRDIEPDYGLHPDLALLLTTSGSTGSPKLVRQSYKNLASNTASIVEYLKIGATSRLITTLPMHYTYGLSMLQTHLYAGATIILNHETILDKKFWQTLKEQRATTFGGVPYIYEMLKRLRFEKMNLPDLRVITQAGGRLAPDLVYEFCGICQKKQIQFIVMYGAAEATARMSYLPMEYTLQRPNSIGIAIPGGAFTLEDENGELISDIDTLGELIYHGDNVAMGYAENRLDLIRADENKTVLHTGDMAKRDQDGFYYIVGRKKRFLKIYGNRINLVEIEDLLHKAGYEAVCAGIDDHLKIYMTNAGQKEHVCRFLSEKTGLNIAAFSAHRIKAIPRNDAGKVLYGELENLEGSL